PGGGSAPRPHGPVFFPGWSVLPGRSAPDPGDLASPTAFLLQPADEAPACGWLAEPGRGRGGPGCSAALGPPLSACVPLRWGWPGAGAGRGWVRAAGGGQRCGDGGSADRVFDTGGSRRWRAVGMRLGRDGAGSERTAWSWAVRSARAGSSCADASALTASSTL